MKLSDRLKRLSHHAYLLISGSGVQADLLSILEKSHGISTRGNPDLIMRTYENLTIDDARQLKSSAEIKPITAGGKRIFIISMNAITVEAQNALLKLFEEPAEYVHFFLIVPSAHLLLPTVKSRLSLIGDAISNKTNDLTDAKKFLAMSAPKRLEAIKSLQEDVSKEKKTKQDAIDLLNDIQATVYESQGVTRGKVTLEAIETARRYIHDRAPSLKMLLEYVALHV